MPATETLAVTATTAVVSASVSRLQIRAREDASMDLFSGGAINNFGAADVADFEDDDTDADDAIYVGLARVGVATNDRERVKNDVILQMAIAEVTETLYVYIDCADKHDANSYASELQNVAWDLASTLGKPQLRIDVVASATSPHVWDDVFSSPDLGAVYGDYAAVRGHETKWLPRHGLLPVAYRSPQAKLAKYFRGGMTYSDDALHLCYRAAVVLVNGTFDHLHNGHKRLLSLAVSACTERLIVGITESPDLLAMKAYPELIEPLRLRKRNVLEFVSSLNSSIEVEFVDVNDKWGPALTCNDIRCLVVLSSEDIEQYDAILSRRVTLGLSVSGVLVRVVRRSERSSLRSSCIRELLAKK